MLIRLPLFTLLLVFSVVSIAFSQANIEFQETTYDFGEITEGTVAEHEFTFTNNGDQPLVLTAVKASCGCTTPSWTKEPVLPGKSGHIKASYNSTNRPGGFHKSITITSNSASPSKVLYIKGTAVKKTSMQPLFTPEELANAPSFHLERSHLQLGKVQMGSSQQANLTVQNTGKTDLEIRGILSSCGCLSLMPGTQLEVSAGASANLEIVFIPRSEGDFTYGGYILSNDLVQPRYQIFLTAEVVPRPDQSSVVKEAPAKISF